MNIGTNDPQKLVKHLSFSKTLLVQIKRKKAYT